MRALNDQRPLVIQGASGAGKSSLLKGGIIPRLTREAPAWLPLRAFRPGANPLLNFAEALARTYADFGPSEGHGVIRDRLMGARSKAQRWRHLFDFDGAYKDDLTPAGLAALDAALEAEGQALRNAAGRPNASILISVDQAEEMARPDDNSGEALADYLRAALGTTRSSWQLSAPTAFPNCKAIAASRTWRRGATTYARFPSFASIAWSRNRPSVTASRSTPSSSTP
jgi:hypothetical protein